MKIKTVILTLIVLLSLAFTPVPFAQVQTASLTVLDIIIQISLGFASLAGVSSLVAVLVQIGKLAHVVKDGTSARWTASLNLLAFIVLVAFGVFQPGIAVAVLDGYAAQVAQIALFVIGFVVQMTTSKPVYVALRNARVPLLAYSYSAG